MIEISCTRCECRTTVTLQFALHLTILSHDDIAIAMLCTVCIAHVYIQVGCRPHLVVSFAVKHAEGEFVAGLLGM
jgi:hypothetical protein